MPLAEPFSLLSSSFLISFVTPLSLYPQTSLLPFVRRRYSSLSHQRQPNPLIPPSTLARTILSLSLGIVYSRRSSGPSFAIASPPSLTFLYSRLPLFPSSSPLRRLRPSSEASPRRLSSSGPKRVLGTVLALLARPEKWRLERAQRALQDRLRVVKR